MVNPLCQDFDKRHHGKRGVHGKTGLGRTGAARAYRCHVVISLISVGLEKNVYTVRVGIVSGGSPRGPAKTTGLKTVH